jgi:hypothetical protein
MNKLIKYGSVISLSFLQLMAYAGPGTDADMENNKFDIDLCLVAPVDARGITGVVFTNINSDDVEKMGFRDVSNNNCARMEYKITRGTFGKFRSIRDVGESWADVNIHFFQRAGAISLVPDSVIRLDTTHDDTWNHLRLMPRGGLSRTITLHSTSNPAESIFLTDLNKSLGIRAGSVFRLTVKE